MTPQLVALCLFAVAAAAHRPEFKAQPAAGVAPLIPLNDGTKIPALALGTWLGIDGEGQLAVVQNNDVENSVVWAIQAGYRNIDTAAIYDTEEQVGRGLHRMMSEGTVKREDMFITTKLWNDHHAKDDVIPALKESLRKLNLDYVDLYLMHWPIAQYNNGTFYDVDYVETWQALQEARAQGLARSVGVSNFNVLMLNRIIKETGVKPAALQIEVNLNLQQPALRDYCRQQGILVQGYTPFGSLFAGRARPDAPPPRADHPQLLALAKKYNKTVPQVVLRYLVELDVVPLPKSVTKSRVEQNIDVFDFSLTQHERDFLRTFDKDYRVVDLESWRSSPYYPF